MPGAVIAIDQVRTPDPVSTGTPGVARKDLWQGRQIQFRSTQSGNLSYAWTLVAKPMGSSAVLVNPDQPSCTMVPDLIGSYRVQLMVNGGGPGNVQILVAAITCDSAGNTVERGWRIPALGEVEGENNWGGNTYGWKESLDYIFADILNGLDTGGVEKGGRAWDNVTTYSAGDIVSYSGLIYIALQTNTSSVPGPGVDWQEYSAGTGTEVGGKAWSSTTAYVVGDVVSDFGSLFIANTSSTNQPPPDPAFWDEVSASGSQTVGKEWDSTVSYASGDLVSYQSDVFIALDASTNVDPTTDETKWKKSVRTLWDANTEFRLGDLVSEAGYVYVALTNSKNVFVTDNTKWRLVQEAGQWVGGVPYFTGAVVVHNTTKLYVCLQPTNSVEPGTDDTYWFEYKAASVTGTLTFQPGGVDSNGVYTDWDALYSDFLLMNGVINIVIDNAFAQPVLPAQSYDLQGRAHLMDKKGPRTSGRSGLSLPVDCYLQDPLSFTGLELTADGSGGAARIQSSGELRFLQCSLISVDGDNLVQTDACRIVLESCAVSSVSGAPFFNMGTAGLLVLRGETFLFQDVLAGSYNLYFESPQIQVSSTQTGAGTLLLYGMPEDAVVYVDPSDTYLAPWRARDIGEALSNISTSNPVGLSRIVLMANLTVASGTYNFGGTVSLEGRLSIPLIQLVCPNGVVFNNVRKFSRLIIGADSGATPLTTMNSGSVNPEFESCTVDCTNATGPVFLFSVTGKSMVLRDTQVFSSASTGKFITASQAYGLRLEGASSIAANCLTGSVTCSVIQRSPYAYLNPTQTGAGTFSRSYSYAALEVGYNVPLVGRGSAIGSALEIGRVDGSGVSLGDASTTVALKANTLNVLTANNVRFQNSGGTTYRDMVFSSGTVNDTIQASGNYAMLVPSTKDLSLQVTGLTPQFQLRGSDGWMRVGPLWLFQQVVNLSSAVVAMTNVVSKVLPATPSTSLRLVDMAVTPLAALTGSGTCAVRVGTASLGQELLQEWNITSADTVASGTRRFIDGQAGSAYNPVLSGAFFTGATTFYLGRSVVTSNITLSVVWTLCFVMEGA